MQKSKLYNKTYFMKYYLTFGVTVRGTATLGSFQELLLSLSRAHA